VKNFQEISRQRLSVHSATIRPDDPIRAEHHTWSDAEQRRNQSSKKFILLREAGAADEGKRSSGGGGPEADECHFNFEQGQLYTEDIPKARREPEVDCELSVAENFLRPECPSVCRFWR
jgi:hypothetical protein